MGKKIKSLSASKGIALLVLGWHSPSTSSLHGTTLSSWPEGMKFRYFFLTTLNSSLSGINGYALSPHDRADHFEHIIRFFNQVGRIRPGDDMFNDSLT